MKFTKAFYNSNILSGNIRTQRITNNNPVLFKLVMYDRVKQQEIILQKSLYGSIEEAIAISASYGFVINGWEIY